jgi:multidrug efflux pump subunit AcrA (membrane-fusion protein)
MPPYVVTSYFWQVVDHWQALIAGIFALVAGGAAYLAGTQQANATRQAAKQQVEATERAAKQQVATANAELEHLKSEKAEEDRRAREDLLAALDTEAARIPLLVQLKCDVARRRHTTGPNTTVAQAEAYKISVGHALTEGRGIPSLVHGEIRLAVIRVLASVEQLNALIETKGLLLNELQGHELIDALLKVHNRADELQGALGEYGGNRRIR